MKLENLDPEERKRLSAEYRALLSALGAAIDRARPIFHNDTIEAYYAALEPEFTAHQEWCKAVDPRFFSLDYVR